MISNRTETELKGKGNEDTTKLNVIRINKTQNICSNNPLITIVDQEMVESHNSLLLILARFRELKQCM